MTFIEIPLSQVEGIVNQVLGSEYTPPAGYDWVDAFWAITKNKHFKDLEKFLGVVQGDRVLEHFVDSFKGRKLNRGNLIINITQ